MQDIELVKQIASLHLDFRKILDEHIADFDEVLPYVYFGHLSDYFMANSKSPVVKQLFKLLEIHFKNGDEEIQTLIAVGVLESLAADASDDAYAHIASLMGEGLREELHIYGRDF